MFLAYADASVKNKTAHLAFVIVFEDKSVVYRRIVVDESDNNNAEALAITELLSFLNYYKLKKGLILLDSNVVKSQLKKKGRKIHKYLPNNTKETLKYLEIRTQVIPRKYNVAHRVCYTDKAYESTPIPAINRGYYRKVENYPDYFLQLSAFEEYRRLFNKPFSTFHDAQLKLNKKIWLAEPVEDSDGIKVYEIHDKRIKVFRETIVKIYSVNYIHIGNHWRSIRWEKKLKRILKS
ncbi:hypothetical protein ABE288_20570 [Bacillus salipaludis]|uniref:hypothetical protein n=1 Tax=Bacillus salipaludis TaxID=2547811 RepID=UPI003D211C64